MDSAIHVAIEAGYRVVGFVAKIIKIFIIAIYRLIMNRRKGRKVEQEIKHKEAMNNTTQMSQDNSFSKSSQDNSFSKSSQDNSFSK